MNRHVVVSVPDRIWATLAFFEPLPPDWGLTPSVRRCLTAAAVQHQADTAATLRRVSLTREEAQLLETWLILVCGRSAAPPDCWTFLERLRDTMRSGGHA